MKFVYLNIDDRIKSEDYQRKLLEDYNNGYLVEWPYYSQWTPRFKPTMSGLQQAVKRYNYLVSKGMTMIAVTETGQRMFRGATAVSTLCRLLFGRGLVKASSEAKALDAEDMALQCWQNDDTTILAITYTYEHDKDIARLKKAGLDVKYCKPSALGYCYMIEFSSNDNRRMA